MEVFEDSVGLRIAEIAGDVNFAVPMVCFCDIPLSRLTEHVTTYGRFGIGLTKEWGMAKGLTPVLYCHSRSDLIDVLGHNSYTIDYLRDQEGPSLSKNTEDSLDVILWNTAFLSCFMKPYIGSFYRRGELLEDVRFYDEMEWRYVPRLMAESGLPTALYGSNAADTQYVTECNERLFNYDGAALEFATDDIAYIFVEDEAGFLEISAQIDLMNEYTNAERVRLKSMLSSSANIGRI